MLNTNQEIIIKALFASNTTAEARESVQDVLSAAQFNSGLGALKRAGYINKKEDGNYEITELAHDEIEFEETAQPVQVEEVTPVVVEGEVMAGEVVVATPVVEEVVTLDGEFEVTSEVDSPIVELYAPMVYSHYQPVIAPKAAKRGRKPKAEKPVKPTKMSDEELEAKHKEFMAALNINPEFIRVVEWIGKSAISTRINKNANRIKAVECYKAGYYRVYTGKVSEELFAKFEEIADEIKIPEHGQTHLINIKYDESKVELIKELLGEIVMG